MLGHASCPWALSCWYMMLCQHSNGITTGHKMMSMFVCLSLLTMTNPNQMCEVLLFVCSKMADETNLRSKLPVADRTREV